MPELPEVETVMRGLQLRLLGRRIVSAAVNRPDLRWPLPPDLAARLTGARVESFRRRAKYILIRLEGGDSVLLHLGMSGRIVIGPLRPNTPMLHEHVVLETDDGWRIALVDPRRFGSIDLVATAAEDSHRLLAGLGPEPLGDRLTGPVLAAALAGRRTPIKAALLDQRVVAGLGNIYVCEALFRTRISPLRQAASITGAKAGRLVTGDQGDAERGDRGRRFQPAGLCAARGGVGLFPARLEGLWPRERALRAVSGPAGLRRNRPDRAIRAQHVLLSAHPALD